MPRQARTVCAGIPHHITQRGNRRDDVFFDDEDRRCYLDWLREYCERHRVDVLAYCLMTNHVHLVAVPATENGLSAVLKPLHMRYAQRINRQCGWKGHLWQGRYFSSALDESYLWAAVRYVERNPVRAKLVRKAERYRWSSARAHCGLSADDVLTAKARWQALFSEVSDWSSWLAEGDEQDQLATLRQYIERGLPCGTDAFVQKLERMTGKSLQCRPRGRPRGVESDKFKG